MGQLAYRRMRAARKRASVLVMTLVASALCLVVTPVEPVAASVPEAHFGAYHYYDVPSKPESLGLADFTGDGLTDVVTNTSFNFDPSHDFRLVLLAQTVDHRLEQRASFALTSQAPQYYPTELDVGDLDGDGKLDVAVASYSAIDLFLGDGQTLLARPSVSFSGALDVKIRDLNGDGRADLVVNGTDGISWLAGHGDGTFEPPTTVGSGRHMKIGLGDVTGDGVTDIVGWQEVIGQEFRYYIRVFAGLPYGGFASSVDYAGGSGDGMVVADVTGDGRDDVALTNGANTPGAAITVYPQRPVRAERSLAPPLSYSSYDIPAPLAAADFNGDGRLDLATVHNGWLAVGVHTQDTDGTLAQERRVSVPDNSDVRNMAVGDVNGDGYNDILYAEGGRVHVVDGAAPGPAPPPTTTPPKPPPPSAANPAPPVDADASSYQQDSLHAGRADDSHSRPPTAKQWVRDLLGDVSYPLITANRAFVRVRTPNTGYFVLHALDTLTGLDAWLPVDLGVGGQFGLANGQPLTLTGGTGTLRMLDAADGHVVWSTQLTGQGHFVGPPVSRNGMIYLVGEGNGATMYALDAADGHQVWSQPAGDAGGLAPPAVSDQMAYHGESCDPAIAWDARSSELKWHKASGCSGGGGALTQAVSGDVLWTRGYYFGSQPAFDARNGNPFVVYEADAAPAFDGDRGYFLANGRLEARDPLTQLPLWSFTGDGQLVGAPIVAGPLVYIASASGQLSALDGATGEVVWTDSIAGGSSSAPGERFDKVLTGMAIAHGRLVVPAGHLLVSYGMQRTPVPPTSTTSTSTTSTTSTTVAPTTTSSTVPPTTSTTVPPALSLKAPYSAWSQPGSQGRDGTATWIGIMKDPAAESGQLQPAYSYDEVFGFESSSAIGIVGLLTLSGQKYAFFSVIAPDGTPHSVAVPFNWQKNRFYLPLVYRLGPGSWGAWVYDYSAGSWVSVGALSVPTSWGKLAPWSLTTVLWHGPSGTSCSAYPSLDAFLYPPLGYIGSDATVASGTSTGTFAGDCPTTISTELPPWHRYRVGS